MKILLVIPTMNPSYGGPCEGIRNFVPELAKRGLVHEVVCMDSPDSDYLGKDSFVIHAIGEAKGIWRYNRNLSKWLVKNIENYDRVIVHSIWLYHSFIVNQIFRKRKKTFPIGYFVMVHGMLDPYFQVAKERKLKAIRNWLYWKFIECKVINESLAILFTCELEQELARLPFKPYRPKNEINVGYGIKSPPTFKTSFNVAFNNLNISDFKSRPYLLFLSRIHVKKGIDLLILAYLRILELNKDLVIPDLVIAGPGIESDFGKKILKMVDSNIEIKRKVHFPGMLSGDSKWGAFYGCQAFILPSHQENFGIAVAEAMACGKPVLITNQINIYKEIQKENAGLIEADTEEGVYNLLNKWLKLNESEREVIGQNALKCYRKHFDIQVTALNLKEVYDNFIN